MSGVVLWLALAGVTLVIVNGSIFDGIRDWCLGFTKKYNIFRLFGELISCTTCTGMWVGALYGVFTTHDILLWFLYGGLTSLTADAVNIVLALGSGIAERVGAHSHEKRERAVEMLKVLLESKAREKDQEEEEDELLED